MFANEKKRIEVNFVDGLEQGLKVVWYQDGKKQSEGTLKKGRYEGKLTTWFPQRSKGDGCNLTRGRGNQSAKMVRKRQDCGMKINFARANPKLETYQSPAAGLNIVSLPIRALWRRLYFPLGHQDKLLTLR